jgi:CRP-like cAMP-binding protein
MDFRKFLKIAEWSEVKDGETIIENGAKVDTLHVLHEGEAQVLTDAKEGATKLGEGDFVGEFSFVTGNEAKGTVRAISEAKLLSWRFEKLRRLFSKSPALEASFQAVVGANLVRKIVEGKEDRRN